MITIYPGITTENKDEFVRIFNKLRGTAPVLAVDISDGVFVPTKLLGVEEIQSASNQMFQVHLMVYKPEEVIVPLLNMPNVESVIFHIEATDPDLVHKDGVNKTQKIIDTIHQAGKQAGIALNPETSVDSIEPFVGQADFIQFMTVYPGAYGGEFQSSVLDKVRCFHVLHPEMPIEIDGGMNPNTVPLAVKAGATMIESGSYIMNSDDPAKAIAELKGKL